MVASSQSLIINTLPHYHLALHWSLVTSPHHIYIERARVNKETGTSNTVSAYWSFIEEDLCDKTQTWSLFKISDVLFALRSDVPPGRGIWWPRAVIHWVSLIFGKPLGQGDIQSDVPLLEASSGQEQNYIARSDGLNFSSFAVHMLER